MEYEKELLKFQYSLGVDNIFDFITGRDFKKRTYNNLQMTAESLSVNMQSSSVDGGSENVEQGLPSDYKSNNHIENAIKNPKRKLLKEIITKNNRQTLKIIDHH